MGKKFFGEEKKKLRSKLWSGEWRMKFVHGNLKDDDARELDLMRENGIEVIPVTKVIEELKDPKFGAGLKTAGIATNMTDLFELCSQHEDTKAKTVAGSDN